MHSEPSRHSENLFIRFCINGLCKMYLPEANTFSASYRKMNGRMQNVRHPRLEFKYSMNTFMGLHNARTAGYDVPFDIDSDYGRLAKTVSASYITPEEIAAAVWAGRVLNVQVPADAMAGFTAIVRHEAFRPTASAQTMAWLICACIWAGDEFATAADTLVKKVIDFYIHPVSLLVKHTPQGLRSDWASFAASCYIAYALLVYGRRCNEAAAIDYGIRIAQKLVGLQGPQGQWGWYYCVGNGTIADYYQVYSVHQEAMAPFFLLEAIDQGHEEFRAPLIKGFRWILGDNELNQRLVSPEHSIVWRSLKRKDRFEKARRFCRGITAKCSAANGTLLRGADVQLNYECRSYELGWALWAFAQRRDFNDLLDDPAFA